MDLGEEALDRKGAFESPGILLLPEKNFLLHTYKFKFVPASIFRAQASPGYRLLLVAGMFTGAKSVHIYLLLKLEPSVLPCRCPNLPFCPLS